MRTFKLRLLVIAGLMNFILLASLLATINDGQSSQRGWVIAGLVIGAMLIELGIIWRLVAAQEHVVHDLTTQVMKLTAPDQTHRILLPADHAYADLGQAINMAAEALRHQSHVFQRQENELDNLLKYLPVGVMVIDRRRQTQLMNPMAVQLLETEQLPLPHLYTQDIKQFDLTAQIEAALREQANRRQTLTLTLPATKRTLEVSTIFTEPRPYHPQVLVLLYDLTEVARIEQMQVDFVANASHELKTPLTAITGFSETLLAGADMDPQKRREFLTIINDQAHQLMLLIEDVLSVSRLQNPTKRALVMTKVDIKTLIDQQIQLQSQSIRRRSLTVVNAISPQFKVQTDAAKFDQIANNLLSNAIKYNHDAGQITINATATPTGWQLTVTDTGQGMTVEQQERIFERFYRGDPSRNKQRIPGTGLGLAIVKELTELLGGHIVVSSRPEAGTTMTVQFPEKIK
ncbi:sensor histidine kinase [Furfurilactobacillus curtus]|uniref:histidine kinase n=1 Tax=Furfurilactobacillus curtus TaxID=1746200 RepID=A0ABQ5JPC4_9LACO